MPEKGWKKFYFKFVVGAYCLLPFPIAVHYILTFLNSIFLCLDEQSLLNDKMFEEYKKNAYEVLRKTYERMERNITKILSGSSISDKTRQRLEKELVAVQVYLSTIKEDGELNVYQIHAIRRGPRK